MQHKQEIVNQRNNRPVALITGASKRIGKSIALELHRRDVDIAIHCNHSKSEAEELCARLNSIRESSSFIIQKDLSELNAPVEILKSTITHYKRLDYLINNASIFHPMPIQTTDIQQFKKITNINASQPRKLIMLASEEIKKHNGAIVNMIDIYASRGHHNNTAYVASKALLLEMTQQFATELAPNIRINSVSPGAILWPENETKEQKRQREKILKKTAIKRVGQASDISKTVVFLLLDALYMTGANINVDGGRSLYI